MNLKLKEFQQKFFESKGLSPVVTTIILIGIAVITVSFVYMVSN